MEEIDSAWLCMIRNLGEEGLAIEKDYSPQ
jgi:hypothetical protein